MKGLVSQTAFWLVSEFIMFTYFHYFCSYAFIYDCIWILNLLSLLYIIYYCWVQSEPNKVLSIILDGIYIPSWYEWELHVFHHVQPCVPNWESNMFHQYLRQPTEWHCLPLRETSNSTSCMKLAISGGSLCISLSLSPSFLNFVSWKKGWGRESLQFRSSCRDAYILYLPTQALLIILEHSQTAFK